MSARSSPGNEPENMPSHWFNLVFGRTYGYDRPFIPRAGAGRLPELLADVIRESGGGIVYNAQPKKIMISDGKAKGVLLDGREIEARNVISGTGILQTVHSLAGKEYFPQGFLNTLGYYKEGFCMASVFTVFRRSAGITPGVHLYAMFPKSVGGMFKTLKDGSFPQDNMYVISVPGAAHDSGGEHLAGTIKFLVPKGIIAREAIEAEAGKVMAKMDSLIPGFRESVIESRLYTPMDYAVNFGFVSSVSPDCRERALREDGYKYTGKGIILRRLHGASGRRLCRFVGAVRQGRRETYNKEWRKLNSRKGAKGDTRVFIY